MTKQTKRNVWLTAAFLAAMTIANVAQAADGDVAVAENAYAALDYPAAVTAAEAVLAQRGLSHDLLVRATRVAGLSHAALGHAEQAKTHFVSMLQYEPDFKVDSKLGPRFSEPFAEARGYWQAQGRKPGIEVEPIVQWGQAGQLRVQTSDPLNVLKKVTVAYRWAPAREYTTSSVEPGTRNVEIPANPQGSTRLDYYVRAADARDAAIFEVGTADAPKSTTVNEPARGAAGEEKKSIFANPLFYIVGGALVAGAAVGAFFLFRPTEYTPTTQARGTFIANCGADRCN